MKEVKKYYNNQSSDITEICLDNGIQNSILIMLYEFNRIQTQPLKDEIERLKKEAQEYLDDED